MGLVGRQTLLWDPDLLEGLMTSSLERDWGGAGGEQEPQAVDGAAVPGSLWAGAHRYS